MAVGKAGPRLIRQLPEQVASRIAAGEVIERPASIIKELVENSLDAAATRIEVEVAGGGLDLLRVSDDGCGIDPEQLHLAFSRHATSKLGEGDDLFAIATLGFRGEALPSMAAVAEVELASRPADEDVGAAIIFRYGDFVRQTARASPPGTSVTVRRVFARQPARLKFLRSRAAEYQQINLVVEHYALARPDVAFKLTVDGRHALLTPGDGKADNALAAVHGHEIARRLLPIGPYADRGVSVEGWVAPPDLNRSNRQSMSLFVNGRWIQNRRLLFALDDAVQGLLPRGRHPIAAVFITIPLDQVDVNAHPTKAEVRFRDEGTVFAVLQRALRSTLSDFAPAAVFFEPGPSAGSPTSFWEPPETTSESRPSATAPYVPDPPQPQVPAARATLPLLRVLGQMGGTYLVAEGPDGMYLIDQHTAHERVLYEEISRRGSSGRDGQTLLTTVTMELSAARAAALGEYADDLRRAGYEFEALDGQAIALRSVPPALSPRDPTASLEEFLDALINDEPGLDRGWKVQATVACHAAVKSGDTMALEEMRALIEKLERSSEPLACPHGRPTLVHLPVETLDRQFGRNWR
jgi:DNA mismatch repair protein MutL